MLIIKKSNGRHPPAFSFLTYRIPDQQAKRGASKFKTVVTIFRKVVNSFKTIALIENRYIVYMNIRQHV